MLRKNVSCDLQLYCVCGCGCSGLFVFQHCLQGPTAPARFSYKKAGWQCAIIMSRMSPFQGLGTRQASARHCFCRFPGSQGFTASFDTRGLGSGRVRLEHRSSKVSSTCPILLLTPRIFEAKQSTVLRSKVVKLINARSISGMLGLRWCWNAIPS